MMQHEQIIFIYDIYNGFSLTDCAAAFCPNPPLISDPWPGEG